MSISERGIGEVTMQPSPPPNSEPPAQCGCGSLSELSEAVRGRPEAERGNLIMLIRHAPRVTVHGMGRNQRDYTPASDEGLGQARTEIVGADLPSVALVASWGVPRCKATANVFVEELARTDNGGVQPLLMHIPGMASRGSKIEWRGGRPGMGARYTSQGLFAYKYTIY
jgi:hypothetical protein